jgi:hypothetical protein
MPGTLPHSLPLLCRFPGPSVPILVSVGSSGWIAMRIQKRLGRSQSDCSAFPNALPPHSDGPQLYRCSLIHLTYSLFGCACLFVGVFFLFCCQLSDCSPLLSFLLAVLLHCEIPGQDDIRIPKSRLALQQPRCAFRGLCDWHQTYHSNSTKAGRSVTTAVPGNSFLKEKALCYWYITINGGGSIFKTAEGDIKG